MSAYRLTVFSPIKAGPAAMLATVLRVEVEEPVEWVRAHADEIAARAVERLVMALWLEEVMA